MKKLIAMIGAAAMSFGLFADAPDPSTYYSTSFEADDAGCGDGTTFDWQAAGWETTFEDAFKLVDQDGVLPYAPGKVRRDEFFVNTDVNNKYLKLETGTNEIKHAIGGADRVFFDQLVKFTGFDEDPVIAADGAKIAVWLKATEENEIETNLYVTVGTGDTATNLQIDREVAVDTWYRLTIKSLGNVIGEETGKVQAGFLIYIDGELATIVDGQQNYHAYTENLLSPANKFYAKGQLFTAIDTTSATLTSVGYQGLGGVDDIIFSKDAPDFAAAAVDVTVTPIEGAIITVKDADGEVIDLVDNVYTIPQGDFTVTYAQAPGWKFTTVTKDYNTGSLPSGNVIDDSAEVIPEKVVAQIIRESEVVAEYAESELTVVLAQGVQDGDQIKFVEGCSALDGAYVFQKDTTIDVTAGGNWDIKVPGEVAELTDKFGAMPEKQIKVTFTDDDIGSTFYLAGNIYGNGRVDTLIDVAGYTWLDDDLTIGATQAAEDGAGAVLKTVELGGFAGGDGDYTITLVGTKAKVVTTTDIAADAFVLDSGYVLNIETNDIEGTDWYTYTQVAAAVDPVWEVNGKKYGSLADALADAKAGDTVTLLKSITLDDTLVVDKAVTIELNGNEIKLAADKAVGIDVTAAATIQDGDITSTRDTYANNAYAILNEAVNATYKNLNIYAANYKFGLTCDSPAVTGEDMKDECETDPTVTVTCENVDIIGNGTLFYAQHTILNLDAYCSATKDPTLTSGGYAAAVYSALNARVTIEGGAYEHDYALISGNLGGKIFVKGGEFTGDIKSWMKVGAHPELEKISGYKALFTLLAGTYDGNIVFEDDNARDLDLFIKGNDVTLNPPEGYKWDEGVLTKIEYATLTITKGENVTAVVVTNALGEVVTEATKFDKDDAVVVAVDLSKTTFAENYELDAAESTLTVTLSADAEIIVKAKEKQQGWPDNPQDVKGQSAGVALGITGKLAGADACELSTWAKDFSVTFNVDVDQYENAFLLNCDPAEVEDAEKAFKFTAITPGETPTTTKQYKGRDYNGTVQITAYEDVGFTKPVDNPTGAEAELFYKAELILVPVNK